MLCQKRIVSLCNVFTYTDKQKGKEVKGFTNAMYIKHVPFRLTVLLYLHYNQSGHLEYVCRTFVVFVVCSAALLARKLKKDNFNNQIF